MLNYLTNIMTHSVKNAAVQEITATSVRLFPM